MLAPSHIEAPPRRRTAAAPLSMTLRRLHGWLGALFAPGLIFFAASGLLQVFDLHKAQLAQGYQPPPAIRVVAALHKDQTLRVKPDKDAAKAGKKGKVRSDAGPDALPKAPPRRASVGELVLKAYATATSAVLALTSLLGLYLAFRTPRDRALNLALLAIGVLAPLGAMLLV